MKFLVGQVALVLFILSIAAIASAEVLALVGPADGRTLRRRLDVAGLLGLVVCAVAMVIRLKTLS